MAKTALQTALERPRIVRGSDRREIENYGLDEIRRAEAAENANAAFAGGSSGFGIMKIAAGDGK